jgi:hydroxymethylglutaryl-CoA synthase
MEHVYDFYKPDMSSEYPVVDANLSIRCYLASLDSCYAKYRAKAAAVASSPAAVASNPSPVASNPAAVSLATFDGVLFHTPYCKLVQKSLARLALNDYVSLSDDEKSTRHPELEAFHNVALPDTYFDRNVEKAFMTLSAKVFEAKTRPSLHVATNVGNMYTPSVYGGLVSYLTTQSAATLPGQRLALFSYGSGLASSFYSLTVGGPSPALDRLLACVGDVRERLDARAKLSPAEFVATLAVREKAVHAAPYTPVGSTGQLFPGTWYLAAIDEKHRRQYVRESPPATTNGLSHEHATNGHAAVVEA